eukprot:m51a1_g1079 putative vesicle-fusing ATPase (809) ;mRNA; r:16365-19411
MASPSPQKTQPKLSARPLTVCNVPNVELALTNQIFVSPADAETLTPPAGTQTVLNSANYACIQDFVFSWGVCDKIAAGQVGLGGVQRRNLNLSLGTVVHVIPFAPADDRVFLTHLRLDVDYLAKLKAGQKPENYDVDNLVALVKKLFANQFFTIGQNIALPLGDINLQISVRGVKVGTPEEVAAAASGSSASDESQTSDTSRGVLHGATVIEMERAAGSQLKLTGGAGKGAGLLVTTNLDPVSLGIGGLNREFIDIVRRTLVSRIFPPAVVQRLGIMHVKGILLHGPPGTGKTLMARTIAKMLNCAEPKIVAGPEMFNKFVGETEKNIRDLFKEAEEEYAQRGDASDLHIIVLDELDALCRARGSRGDGTGTGDSAVNQLLAKIDGVNALNNILLIGMTNRKDMIDEALLRPGRMEVHIEVGLPDEEGRLQILRIHTSSMSKYGFLAPDVDLVKLAKETKNYTGAEIAGLVKSATSFALMQKIDFANLKQPEKPEEIAISMDHFEGALRETHPAFGVDETDFTKCYPNGIIPFGPRFERTQSMFRTLFDQVRRENTRTPLVSVLLSGRSGSGKTALSVKMAVESGFPLVKIISPEELVKYGSEQGRCSRIVSIFEDSYKSPMSVVIVDDIERLLDYVPLGPRFSNAVLQTLLVLVKKAPPPGRKLLVVGTTTNPGVLREMGLYEAFNASLEVPLIHGPAEIKTVLAELGTFGKKGDHKADPSLERAAQAFGPTGEIGIKRLIMLTELARQFADPLEGLVGALSEAGLGGEDAPRDLATSTGGSALAVAVAAANALPSGSTGTSPAPLQ